MTQGRDQRPAGGAGDHDAGWRGGSVSAALRRLAAALEAVGGAAGLADEEGRIVRLDAGVAFRRTLGAAGIDEGKTLFDPATARSAGADGWCQPLGADVQAAVAPVPEGRLIPGYAVALAPSDRVPDPSTLLSAASLAAFAIAAARRAHTGAAHAAREEALRRGIVANAPDPTVLVDAAGCVLDANGLAGRVLGTRLAPGLPLFETLLGSGVLDRQGVATLRSIESGAVAAAEIRLGRGAPARAFLVESAPIREGTSIVARVLRFRSRQDAARIAAGSRSLVDVERRALVLALEETRWNISETARRLGVTRPTVYSMIRRHRISPGSR